MTALRHKQVAITIGLLFLKAILRLSSPDTIYSCRVQLLQHFRISPQRLTGKNFRLFACVLCSNDVVHYW